MDGTGTSILVVEDEVFVAWDIAQTLEDAGYRVTGPAHTLEEGMDLLDTTIDHAILDVNLGDKTVWPLADRLKALGIPFVFATADLGHPELEERFSCAPKLSKPIDSRRLLDAIGGKAPVSS